jgi:ABC-2 type transport system permease protein
MNSSHGGRLSTLAAAFVVARRDFMAILGSRSFIFFLLGPLFPLLVGFLASAVGNKADNNQHPQIGIIMEGREIDAMLSARAALLPTLGDSLPPMTVLRRLKPGEAAPSAQVALADPKQAGGNLGAVLTGTAQSPRLTGAKRVLGFWRGPVALIAAKASGHGPDVVPNVQTTVTQTAGVTQNLAHNLTGQAAQTGLFMLTMMLAGMVLSNLAEEKGNKIIEILAAAIPMDAVFLGKLFAMLAVSFVGIGVWALGGALLYIGVGMALPVLAEPAVGWPLFVALGIIYFAMAYLLLGSVYLTIGAQAATVREIQTLNMPVVMSQVLVFFFASFAVTRPDTVYDYAAMAVPFSSPYAMLARAATHEDLWWHAGVIAWQVLWVGLFIKGGAALFRSRVMKSGPQGANRPKSGLIARLRGR